MDIVSECLSAAMWLAEDVIWTVVTMFHYGFNIICEMMPGIFEALHSVGHWSSYTLSHTLLTVAECGCHVLIITGSCLSYAIIAIAQWTIQCMVFCASLFYSCGRFVAALPWVEVFTTFFQSATSTVSLLRQQGQNAMGLAWNIIKYVIVVHAALFIVLVVVILLILYIKYHRRVTTSRAAVLANALHLPRMQTNRQPRRQSEEREEHIDRTDTPMVHDSVHTRPTPTVTLGGGGPSTQDGETTSMFRKELEEGEHLRRRVSQLSVELSREKDKSVCVVCLDAKRDVLLNPCKHFCLCRNCINTIRNCPICNRRIHSSERIFNV